MCDRAEAAPESIARARTTPAPTPSTERPETTEASQITSPISDRSPRHTLIRITHTPIWWVNRGLTGRFRPLGKTSVISIFCALALKLFQKLEELIGHGLGGDFLENGPELPPDRFVDGKCRRGVLTLGGSTLFLGTLGRA